MKSLQIIALLFFIAASAFANGIDSLHTEQQVKKFLKDSLEQSGLIVLRECVGIPPAIKFSRHEVAVDSIPVTDTISEKPSYEACTVNTIKSTVAEPVTKQAI